MAKLKCVTVCKQFSEKTHNLKCIFMNTSIQINMQIRYYSYLKLSQKCKLWSHFKLLSEEHWSSTMHNLYWYGINQLINKISVGPSMCTAGNGVEM